MFSHATSPRASACRLRAISLTFVLATTVLGCKPKPIAEVPSLSNSKGPDTTDRELPGGKTIAAALPLLDPRSGDFDELARRRHQFEEKLAALVPVVADREALGFQGLLAWHELYARRRQALDRAIDSLKKGTAGVLAPGAGFETRIDATGQAKICPIAADPSTPAAEGSCRRVTGFRQLESDFGGVTSAVADALEAQWFVMANLDALRARLDPVAAAAPVNGSER